MKDIEIIFKKYDKGKLNRSISYLRKFYLEVKKKITKDNFDEISQLLIASVSYLPKKLILANSLKDFKEKNFKDLDTPFLSKTIGLLIQKRKFYPQKKLGSKKIKSTEMISTSKLSSINSSKPIYNSPKS